MNSMNHSLFKNQSMNNPSRTPNRTTNSTTLWKPNMTLNRTLGNITQNPTNAEFRVVEQVDEYFNIKIKVGNLKNPTSKYVLHIMGQMMEVLGIHCHFDHMTLSSDPDEQLSQHRLYLYHSLRALYRTLPEETPLRTQIMKYEFIIRPNRSQFIAFLTTMCNIQSQDKIFQDEFIKLCHIYDNAEIQLDSEFDQLNRTDVKELRNMPDQECTFIQNVRQLIEERFDENERLTNQISPLQEEFNLVAEKFLKC